ncbi:MAG TPA: LysM peptidoglycan-binding domain-containing protein [Acidimicrobiia bacterium]|nr:LysM peptidoglycan-binding domain-containing protein [Acidimicrobiia bacterium]
MLTRHQSLSLRLLILLTGAGIVFLLISGRVEASPPPAPPTEYRVVAGDTLWSIASDLAGPSVDVRSVVADIKRDNGLQTSALNVGQVLVIPAS